MPESETVEAGNGALVKPKGAKLSGAGFVWEFLLAEQGFNDLPDDKKIGRVVGAFNDGTLDVYFDALNYTAKYIFPDELIFIPEPEAPHAKV